MVVSDIIPAHAPYIGQRDEAVWLRRARLDAGNETHGVRRQRSCLCAALGMRWQDAHTMSLCVMERTRIDFVEPHTFPRGLCFVHGC